MQISLYARNVLINNGPDGLWVIEVEERRLIDIEVKLAHQEHALEEINEILTDQQAQITRLGQVCQSLADRLRAMSETSGTEARDDEKPPHY